jgi:hypothetical protein
MCMIFILIQIKFNIDKNYLLEFLKDDHMIDPKKSQIYQSFP